MKSFIYLCSRISERSAKGGAVAQLVRAHDS